MNTTMQTYIAQARAAEELTRDQQVQLWQDMRTGGLRHREAAYNRLWLECIRLVLFAAADLTKQRRILPTDDQLQEGLLAAGKALTTWDPKRGALTTWIIRHAKWAMQDYYSKQRTEGTGGKDAPRPTMVSLDDDAGSVDDPEDEDTPGAEPAASVSLHEIIGAEPTPDAAEEDQRDKALRAAVQQLPALHRGVIDAIYGLDGNPPVTATAYAAQHSVHKSTISRLITEAHKRIRATLEKSRESVDKG